MKNKLLKRNFPVFLFLVLFSLLFCSKESENTEAEFKNDFTTINPHEQNARIGRCMNLGNALEAPTEGEWGVVLNEEYFQKIKEAGFSSVRIPIRWSTHAAEASPFTIETKFMQRVNWAVDQALSRDLGVIINIHHYEEIMQSPEEHKARYLGFWEQIAGHFKNYSENLLFEVLNEPNANLTSQLWNQYLKDGIAIIRKTNPTRNLIIGTANWGGIDGLKVLQLPEDDVHLIATIHYYNPFEFTHQGAEWVDGSDAWLGKTWTGKTEEKNAIIKDFDFVASWSNENNRPVFVGEFGSYNKADMASRVFWTSFVARTAEERNMSWAYWEFCSGFGIYDPVSHQYYTNLLNALIP